MRKRALLATGFEGLASADTLVSVVFFQIV